MEKYSRFIGVWNGIHSGALSVMQRDKLPKEWYQIGMLFLHRSLAGVKDGQDHGQKHD